MTDENVHHANPDQTADAGFDDQAVDANLAFAHSFDPAKISVRTTRYTISLITDRFNYQEVDLEPSLQHRARLWNIGDKSHLIESLLLRIPLPLFYIAEDSKGNWKVLDGIQRLTTIFDFIAGQFKLSGLEYMTQLNGLHFSELPRQMQRRINETELPINIFGDEAPADMMINIVKRLNTGGITLTQQEIRNVVYAGEVRQFLLDLVNLPSFQAATDNSVSDARMAAQEMVLVFLAFQLTPWQAYVAQNPVRDSFLNNAMHQLNEMPAAKRQQLLADFERTMSFAYALFGNNAFRKARDASGKRKPINRPLFEAWSSNLAKLSEQQQASIVSKKAELNTLFEDLLKDERFIKAISFAATNVGNIRYRFEKIQQIIDEVLQ